MLVRPVFAYAACHEAIEDQEALDNRKMHLNFDNQMHLFPLHEICLVLPRKDPRRRDMVRRWCSSSSELDQTSSRMKSGGLFWWGMAIWQIYSTFTSLYPTSSSFFLLSEIPINCCLPSSQNHHNQQVSPILYRLPASLRLFHWFRSNERS